MPARLPPLYSTAAATNPPLGSIMRCCLPDLQANLSGDGDTEMKRLREDSGADMEAEGEDAEACSGAAAAAEQQQPNFIGPQLPPGVEVGGPNGAAGAEGMELHDTFRDRARYIPLRCARARLRRQQPPAPAAWRLQWLPGSGVAQVHVWHGKLCRLASSPTPLASDSLYLRAVPHRNAPTSALLFPAPGSTWRSAGCCDCWRRRCRCQNTQVCVGLCGPKRRQRRRV